MEELFRFSVVRPVGKQTRKFVGLTTQLPARGKTPLTLAQTFESSVAATLDQLKPRGTNEEIWSQLEIPAATYLAAATPTVSGDPLWAELLSFVVDLQALGAATAPKPDAGKIQAVFAAHPSLTAAAVTDYQRDLSDLFLASVIVRRGGSSRLAPLLDMVAGLAAALTIELPAITAALQAAAALLAGGAPLLAAIVAASDPKTKFNAALAAELSATLLLPHFLTQGLKRPVLGAGLRELHVVKQHIRRYEQAEIARIENILAGETRDHQQKHILSTEIDTFLQTTDTTETDKELDTNDKTSVKNEADDQVKTDTKVDGGVHAQYSGPSFKLQADLTASYDRAEETTRKYSTDTAKEITQKAVSKVTDQVTRSQTTKIKEKLLDWEQQRFDNAKGTTNVVGVYQWVEKVYLSQVFNLGRHLLIDITVPEPGANLLAMATSTTQLKPGPIEPHPLGSIKLDAQGNAVLDQFGRQQMLTALNPLDLTESPTLANGNPDPNFYGTWVARYGATGVAPPPLADRTYTKGKSFDFKDDDDKAEADTIAIDEGYEGYQLDVTVTGMRNDNPGSGSYSSNVFAIVTVGTATSKHVWPGSARSASIPGMSYGFAIPVTGNVDFTVYGHNFDQMVVEIQIAARRTSNAFNAWKLQTYEKIVAAYQNLENAYLAAIVAQQMATQSVGPLGAANPEVNRAIERVELKRSCIAIFDNANATVAGSPVMNPSAYPPTLPEPNLAIAQSLGARVRWFEQAFEWENVAYVLYPYYWGRREMWLTRFALTNDDPLFLDFLQAGYARVVVPVRLGFEKAVQFYLNTGLPWLGGDLPIVGDNSHNPLYLDVAEEIKALTGGGEEGELDVPIGHPWEYTLPTTTILLRVDGKTPEWHRIDLAGNESNDAPSNAPPDPWTWRDGAPTI